MNSANRPKENRRMMPAQEASPTDRPPRPRALQYFRSGKIALSSLGVGLIALEFQVLTLAERYQIRAIDVFQSRFFLRVVLAFLLPSLLVYLGVFAWIWGRVNRVDLGSDIAAIKRGQRAKEATKDQMRGPPEV